MVLLDDTYNSQQITCVYHIRSIIYFSKIFQIYYFKCLCQVYFVGMSSF